MLRRVRGYLNANAATMTDGATGLSAEQIAQFGRVGFLAIPRITTDAEVAWMREVYDRLFERKPGWSKGDFFDFAGDDLDQDAQKLPQLLNPSRYEPMLAKTVFHASAKLIARQLLGPNARLIFEHAMLKPARTGGETAWHQDAAFYARYTNYRAVTIWMPLQPVDERNGCMRFIPGSQDGPVKDHRRIGDNPRAHGLEAIGIDPSAAIACPLPAGGATIHGDRTMHHAGANSSDEPRRAYALVFGVRSRTFVLREEHPWNLGVETAREARARKARGLLGNCASAIKEAGKALLRR